MPTPRPRRFQTGAGTLDDQFPLELGEAGEDREDKSAVGSGGVDRRAFAGKHLEADATLGKIADRVDEVAQIAAEPVELPYDQRVITAQRFQAGTETGPPPGRSIMSSACAICSASASHRVSATSTNAGCTNSRPSIPGRHYARSSPAPVNVRAIEADWDETLRLAASIRGGHRQRLGHAPQDGRFSASKPGRPRIARDRANRARPVHA